MPHGSPSYTINGAALRDRREDAGWSQRELAARCADAGQPVDASRISSYETGNSNPRPRILKVLVTVLGCKKDDLINQVEPVAA